MKALLQAPRERNCTSFCPEQNQKLECGPKQEPVQSQHQKTSIRHKNHQALQIKAPERRQEDARVVLIPTKNVLHTQFQRSFVPLQAEKCW